MHCTIAERFQEIENNEINNLKSEAILAPSPGRLCDHRQCKILEEHRMAIAELKKKRELAENSLFDFIKIKILLLRRITIEGR